MGGYDKMNRREHFNADNRDCQSSDAGPGIAATGHGIEADKALLDIGARESAASIHFTRQSATL
jgi:hypothetical protein